MAGLIQAVCQLTGHSPEQLVQVDQARGANPARRFAAWALRQDARLRSADVGRALGMTAAQVQNVICRLRADVREPIAGWQTAWRSDRTGAAAPPRESDM